MTDETPQDTPAAVRNLAAAFPEAWREPPLGWVAVFAWETEHAVVLPDPYRTFVATVANGSSLGPPEDGLLPLGWLPPDSPFEDQDIAADFPLEEAWWWEEDERDADETASLVDAVFRRGSVVLGTGDGPCYWLLIVSGAQRGNVWQVSEAGAAPFDPTGEGQGVTFEGWVQCWQEAPESWDLPSAS